MINRWRYKCDIKQHFIKSDNLDDTYDDEKFGASRDAVVTELKKAKDYPDDDELWSIVDELEGTQDADEFNAVLQFRLYDWADYNRVWLGLL